MTTTAFVRQTVPVAQLMPTQGEALSALHAFLSAHSIPPAGPPYVRYHTFGAETTDVEVGVPVAQSFTGQGKVAAGELPDGAVVEVVHIGSHDGLGSAYERLAAAVTESGRAPAGPAWEVYHWIDLTRAPDPASWPAPDEWRTDLVQPVTG
jgi:effector-binding domain-containing protein